jgi:hypothetical protein
MYITLKEKEKNKHTYMLFVTIIIMSLKASTITTIYGKQLDGAIGERA